MQALGGDSISFPVMMLYGILILLYLTILRLMLDMLQQMGKKHVVQKFVVDADIQRARTGDADRNMHEFDSYGLAITIAKTGLLVLGTAALMVMSVIKLGFIATVFLIAIAILVIWLVSSIIKMIQHTKIIQSVRKAISRSGNTGSVLMLSIALVVVLFIMTLVS